MGTNCPGCNPRELTAQALGRARALVVRTGVSVAHRPQARIDSGGTPPRIAWGATPRAQALGSHFLGALQAGKGAALFP